MPVTEYTEMEVGRVGNIYEGFMTEEAVRSDRPVWFWIRGMGSEEGIEDVTIKPFLVHDYCHMENGIY